MSIAIFISMGSSFAWNSGQDKTHEHIAAQIYNDMPTSINQNLDLTYMKRGADKPDDIDRNKKYRHAYPASVTYTEKYLKLAKTEYQKAIKTGDPSLKDRYYKRESYFLGMASHYISDTFAAPHTTHVKYYDEFYKLADKVTNIKTKAVPAFNLKTHNGLNNFLRYGKTQGYKVAQSWNKLSLRTHKSSADKLVEDNLNLAYSATLAVFKQWLGF